MKMMHITAIACFVIALVSYFLESKPDIVAGFTVLGFFFETIGWKNYLTKSSH